MKVGRQPALDEALCRAVAMTKLMQRKYQKYPGPFQDGRLRTLQRRIKT